MINLFNKMNELDEGKKDLILNRIYLLAEHDNLTLDSFFSTVSEVVEADEVISEVTRVEVSG